jgi:hypothetical protein
VRVAEIVDAHHGRIQVVALMNLPVADIHAGVRDVVGGELPK